MIKKLLLFLPIFLAVASAGAKVKTKKICSPFYKKQCLIEERHDNYAVFSFTKPHPYEVSVFLDFKLYNAATNPPSPNSIVITSTGTQRIVTIQPKDPDRSWNYWPTYRWRIGSFKAIHDDKFQYVLPYRVGEAYEVVDGFRELNFYQGEGQHAIAFSMKLGTPVYASRGGTVVEMVKTIKVNKERNKKALGNYVKIRHWDKTIGVYAYFEPGGIFVELGDRVYTGRHLGFSNYTGIVVNPSLHFEVHNPTPDGGRKTLPVFFQTKQGLIKRFEEDVKYEAILDTYKGADEN